MKTKILTGPFAEPGYTYKRPMLDYKAACNLLHSGKEVVCIYDGKRISIVDPLADPDEMVFKVNLDDINLDKFISTYSKHTFESCEED